MIPFQPLPLGIPGFGVNGDSGSKSEGLQVMPRGAFPDGEHY